LTHESEPEEVQDTPIAEIKPKSGQRQQPKRKKRAKPAGQGDAKPGPTREPDGRQPARRPQPGANPSATADGDA
jgi:hypothetical protein